MVFRNKTVINIFYFNNMCLASFIVDLYKNQTVLHVSTVSCHHQTVYSQCIAKLHTFLILQLLIIQHNTITVYIYIYKYIYTYIYISQQAVFVMYSVTCFDSSLSPTESLQSVTV